MFYADLVRSMGHMPVVCSDGIAVLDMVTAHPDIDLILMDIDLPGAWGEQLIEIIRAPRRSRERSDPVVSAPRHGRGRADAPGREGRASVVREASGRRGQLAAAITSCLDRSAALDLFDVPDGLPAPAECVSAGGSWLLEA